MKKWVHPQGLNGNLMRRDWGLYKILCKNININPLNNIDEVAEEFANDIQNICKLTVPKTSNKPRKIRPPWVERRVHAGSKGTQPS